MLRFFSNKYGKAEIETHRQNYRIAFDAMRAYHQSEIEHKKDVISVLNNILITMLTVFGDIYYLIFTASMPFKNSVVIAIIADNYWDLKKETSADQSEKGYRKTLGMINVFANLLILINLLAASVAIIILLINH